MENLIVNICFQTSTTTNKLHHLPSNAQRNNQDYQGLHCKSVIEGVSGSNEKVFTFLERWYWCFRVVEIKIGTKFIQTM